MYFLRFAPFSSTGLTASSSATPAAPAMLEPTSTLSAAEGWARDRDVTHSAVTLGPRPRRDVAHETDDRVALRGLR